MDLVVCSHPVDGHVPELGHGGVFDGHVVLFRAIVLDAYLEAGFFIRLYLEPGLVVVDVHTIGREDVELEGVVVVVLVAFLFLVVGVGGDQQLVVSLPGCPRDRRGLAPVTLNTHRVLPNILSVHVETDVHVVGCARPVVPHRCFDVDVLPILWPLLI